MMKATEIKATITVSPEAKVVALIMSMLEGLYQTEAQRVIKTVAARYDLTVNK